MLDCANTHIHFPETLVYEHKDNTQSEQETLEKHKLVVFHQSMKSTLRDLLNATAEYNLLWLIMWSKD